MPVQQNISWAALLSPGCSTRYSKGVTMEWQKEMWRATSWDTEFLACTQLQLQFQTVTMKSGPQKIRYDPVMMLNIFTRAIPSSSIKATYCFS